MYIMNILCIFTVSFFIKVGCTSCLYNIVEPFVNGQEIHNNTSNFIS